MSADAPTPTGPDTTPIADGAGTSVPAAETRAPAATGPAETRSGHAAELSDRHSATDAPDRSIPASGSGDSHASDHRSPTSSDETSSPFDMLRPEEQATLVRELVEDSNPHAPLSEHNAREILRGGPPGSRIRVAGKGVAGPDVTYVNEQTGDVVAISEVKCTNAERPTGAAKLIGDAAKQIHAHPSAEIGLPGQIHVQLPRGADERAAAAVVENFRGSRSPDRLSRYAGLTVAFWNSDGPLGSYPLVGPAGSLTTMERL